jgi:2-hydroxychromene-2-carboxylate isomerase
MSVFEGGNRGLTVLLDIRLPFAYLALHPAVALAEECGVEIDFLPVTDSPLKAPSAPLPEDDRGVRHRRHRAHAIAREIETYAAAQGLALADYYRSPDPTTFHISWLWMRQRRDARLVAFLAEAFRAYWSLEFDPSNRKDVERLVESFDAEVDVFQEWSREQGRARADELAEELIERGLTRAPTSLIEDEVFVGRQHLPMIRWILEGRVGAGPI